MKLEILGCAGSAVGPSHSTCVLLDDVIALDAGTGLHRLPLHRLLRVQDVVITHAHLDHIVMLCFLIDAQIINGAAIKVHCLPEIAEHIRNNLLNNKIWPDMEKIPVNGVPSISFSSIAPYEPFEVQGRRLTPLPVEHGVPCTGFCLHGERENFVFCSDMIDAPDETWQYLAKLENFRRMTMEVSFSNGMEQLAEVSYHLTPDMLAALAAKKLPAQVEVLYNHAKMHYAEQIKKEVAALPGPRKIHPLQQDSIIEF